MTGKALSVGDTTHWQSGATLMKSNEKLHIGSGLEVEFGILDHAGDDATTAASNYVYLQDSRNLTNSADDYYNAMDADGLGGEILDYDAAGEVVLQSESTTGGAINDSITVNHTGLTGGVKVGREILSITGGTGTGTIPSGAYVTKVNTTAQFEMNVASTGGVRNGATITFEEKMTGPFIKGQGGGTTPKAGTHYTVNSFWSFDGKIEETCIWNRLVFPVGADESKFNHSYIYHLQELPDGNINAGSQTYNAKLFIKDYHNIRGARPSRVATSNQVAWRKPSFSLNTT
jgi:hypothetical protein